VIQKGMFTGVSTEDETAALHAKLQEAMVKLVEVMCAPSLTLNDAP